MRLVSDLQGSDADSRRTNRPAQVCESPNLKIDFDAQKDLLKKLNVRMQSSLIVYKQGVEVGRSVGDTNRDSIAELLSNTI